MTGWKQRAAAAFYAAEVGHTRAVADYAARLGRPLTLETSDSARAKEAADYLKTAGVDLTSGTPSLTGAARTLYEKSPWVRGTPLHAVFAFQHPTVPTSTATEVGGGQEPRSEPQKRVYGRTMRGVDAISASELHADLDEHRQVCMVSSGGEGSGALWSTVPARAPVRIVNAQWAMATRSRLGLSTLTAPGQACAMRCAKDDEDCGQQLDTYLHHPSICASGKKARMRCHSSVAMTVKKHLERTGVFADLERPIPEFT